MPQALITRLRGILASRTDDYFENDDLLDYLNEGYKAVVSTGVKLESDQPEIGGRSIRALDQLRVSVDISDVTLTKFRTFYTGNVDVNGATDMPVGKLFMKELYIGATQQDCRIPMSEITMSRKHKLDFGHLRPTQQQSYYEFVGIADVIFKIYVPDRTAPTVHVTMFIQPDALIITSETLPDLPDRLIHAVVLKAATFAGVQEIRENRDDYNNLFQTEITEHLW